MKKLRLVFGIFIASGLLISQLPGQGRCLVAKAPAMADMPCCKKPAQMPLNCPVLKTSPAQDVIMGWASLISAQFQQIALIDVHQTIQQLLRSYWIVISVQTFRPAFLRPSISTRAPPTEVVTLSA